MKQRLTNRERLLRMTRGENIDNSLIYDIEFSVDIRGNITIWGGSSHLWDEVLSIKEVFGDRRKVHRTFIPLYDYSTNCPYTARIAQIERDIQISDETLIEEYERFRQVHPVDGFGTIFKILNIGKIGETLRDEQGRELVFDRIDKEQERERLLQKEREDILSLWGVDCPPDINTKGYNERVMCDRGCASKWFREEFERIGGRYEELFNQR